uniref:Uncharacterized protein n=1 Tax=Kalanchoe fedtschenkoi TaxID=63787 RepID=A0A7N0TVR7_KALFE
MELAFMISANCILTCFLFKWLDSGCRWSFVWKFSLLRACGDRRSTWRDSLQKYPSKCERSFLELSWFLCWNQKKISSQIGTLPSQPTAAVFATPITCTFPLLATAYTCDYHCQTSATGCSLLPPSSNTCSLTLI